MTFIEALRIALDGGTIRRGAWGPRRSVRMTPEPWSGENNRLFWCDLQDGGKPLFAFTISNEDAHAEDWVQVQ